MKKRNYATLRSRLADAIGHELLREDGHWPAVKAKVRGTLTGGLRPISDLYQLADVAAAAVLDCDQVSVSAVRKRVKV